MCFKWLVIYEIAAAFSQIDNTAQAAENPVRTIRLHWPHFGRIKLRNIHCCSHGHQSTGRQHIPGSDQLIVNV
jgi:hypothetical protein